MELECDYTLAPNTTVLIHCHVDIDLLSKLGKKYKWQKPDSCPKCGSKLWGHGFVSCFLCYITALFLKRYRCPNCKIVITIKPRGFWKKYQFRDKSIYHTLKYRLFNYKWPANCTRQRGGHWLKKYLSKIKMDYGLDNTDISLIDRLDILFNKGIAFLG